MKSALVEEECKKRGVNVVLSEVGQKVEKGGQALAKEVMPLPD